MSEPISPRIPEAPVPVQEIAGQPIEHGREVPVHVAERAPEPQAVELVPPVPVVPVPLVEPTQVNPLVKNVESVLASGLDEAYASMDPATQEQFKIEGEKTASAIAQLLTQSKVQVKKIISLIVSWLRFIPHVNRFYLEQQAQIKANEIINLKRT